MFCNICKKLSVNMNEEVREVVKKKKIKKVEFSTFCDILENSTFFLCLTLASGYIVIY